MSTISQGWAEIKAVLVEIKAAIAAKGVTIPANTPVTDYADLISDIPSGDNSTLIHLIEGTATEITIPDGTTKISSGFFRETSENTINKTSIQFPKTGLLAIGNSAFNGCIGITTVTIPEGVKQLGHSAFYGCTNLASINMPQTIEYIGTNVVKNTAFYNKASNWLYNKILYIGSSYCIDSKGFDTGFSQNVSLKKYTRVIAAHAFSYKRDLNNVELNSGLKYICDSAFAHDYITTINLPNSLLGIGEGVFEGCSGLNNVTVESGFNCDNLNLS
ncbi:MAG: leucine-rich repeat domain-containing protein, partial [Clostridia bacterium]|nr:leucine-rich repeat domain-containing protein [Clostridia bacterium]